MKVCTDSCLFGAWVAQNIENIPLDKMLDIGAGTGLLSLMLAQQKDCNIDAIEIDQNASEQAKENIESSDWKNNIKIINQSLQEFKANFEYDFIFSNPPFFEDDLLSDDNKKNQAKHHSSLTLKKLMHFFSLHLKINGAGALLIPYHRLEYLKLLLNDFNFGITHLTLVKQSDNHNFFRAMVMFSSNKNNIDLKSDEIIIHDSNRNYTKEFIELLKDYYLNF